RDLSSHKLVTASRPFMVEENAAQTKHVVGFAVVSGQIETGDLTDAVRRPRVKRRLLRLWCFANLTKHLARTGKIEATTRAQFAQCCEHVVGAVDVCIHRREAVARTFRHESLRRAVIALGELVLTHDVEYRRITLEACRMQDDLVQQVREAREASLRIFQCDASY